MRTPVVAVLGLTLASCAQLGGTFQLTTRGGGGHGGGGTAGVGGSTGSSSPQGATAAPQTGDTAGCPTVDVLAHHGSGGSSHHGYYLLDRKGGIAEPDPSSLDKKVAFLEGFDPNNEEALGEADGALTTLYGYRCAYWKNPTLATMLERGRKAYAARTGVDPEIEKAFHLFTLDDDVFKAQSKAVCTAGEKWPVVADPMHSAVVAAAGCVGVSGDRGHTLGYLWNVIDLGNTSALVQAAALEVCSFTSDYYTWKVCQLDAAKVTLDALKHDLAGSGANQFGQYLALRNYEIARHRLDARAPEMAKLEHGYPSNKEMFDAVVKQVDDYYLPTFAKWGKRLADLDAWEAGLAGGPGNAGDCVPTLEGTLQGYVDSVVKKADGNALLDALKDPIGHRYTHALALCLTQKGDRDSGAVLDQLSNGGDQVSGYHDAIDSLLHKDGTGGRYKKIELSSQRVGLEYQRFVVDGATVERAQHTVDAETEVASVGKEGDSERVSFVHSGKRVWSNNICEVDYSTVVGIDDYGNFRYAMHDCKPVYSNVNLTPSPVLIPKGSGGPVAKGLFASVYYNELHPNDEKKAEPGRVVWVRRGHDVIWAMGIIAR